MASWFMQKGAKKKRNCEVAGRQATENRERDTEAVSWRRLGGGRGQKLHFWWTVRNWKDRLSDFVDDLEAPEEPATN